MRRFVCINLQTSTHAINHANKIIQMFTVKGDNFRFHCLNLWKEIKKKNVISEIQRPIYAKIALFCMYSDLGSILLSEKFHIMRRFSRQARKQAVTEL